ncbi:MAG: GAF domain-containing protein [candidate division Zixibacteria bacterium]|nr:GAF domain-containing protein [candidate division Zixibacteria bacterium]
MMENTRIQLIDNIRIAIAQENSRDGILKVAAELIDAYSEDFNWTGFYMLDGDRLKVGPYVGPVTEHTVIELDAGICGAAASQKQTIIVDDVRNDPRFLACSIHTRSEIVVPLMDGETVLGEIDIDSNRPRNFTAADRTMLEKIAEVVVQRLKQI